MGQKDNILNCRLIKRDNKLVPINSGMSALYEAFVESLEEGQEVGQFLEAGKDDGTTLQLAKIHVFIRKLAQELGYTFDEMKTEIKSRSGLIYDDHVKSFGKCSKEELGSVLEEIKKICDMAGVPYI